MTTAIKTKNTTSKLIQTSTAKLPSAKKVKPAPEKIITVPAVETSTVVKVKTKAPKKIKLVRYSFTIPTSERLVLNGLKQRALELQTPMKKSDLIRAGIQILATMDNTSFIAILKSLPSRKI
ncbi:MAG: hypothetical protein RI956_474 [Pseudomonadota bacterium]|jgi:hypothetical protein